jgi:hypothetical protein
MPRCEAAKAPQGDGLKHQIFPAENMPIWLGRCLKNKNFISTMEMYNIYIYIIILKNIVYYIYIVYIYIYCIILIYIVYIYIYMYI